MLQAQAVAAHKALACAYARTCAIMQSPTLFSIGVNTSDTDQHTALANRCHVGDLPLVPATQRHIDKQTHMPIIPAVTQNLPQQRTCCHSKTATTKNMPQLRALLCPLYETLSYHTTKQSEMATNTLAHLPLAPAVAVKEFPFTTDTNPPQVGLCLG
jgi:hypothetical protein